MQIICPFMARVNHIEALLYEDHIGAIKMFGTSNHGGPKSFTLVKDQALCIKAAYEESDRILEVTPIIIDEKRILDGSKIFEI